MTPYLTFAPAFALTLALFPPALLAAEQLDVPATYLRFVEAQNARDPERIRSFFTESPDFLWVSDGQDFWGPEDVIARMSNFQKAVVWRVEPDVANARLVKLGEEVALYHLGLTLVIGSQEDPSRLPFLVTVVMIQVKDGWKIAGLLTANAKIPK